MKELLLAAKHEIERLRFDNQILTAKVSVLDIISAVTGHRDTRPMGMMEDIAWSLGKEIDRLSPDPLKDRLVEIAKRWPAHEGVNWETTTTENLLYLIEDALKETDRAKQPCHDVTG